MLEPFWKWVPKTTKETCAKSMKKPLRITIDSTRRASRDTRANHEAKMKNTELVGQK